MVLVAEAEFEIHGGEKKSGGSLLGVQQAFVPNFLQRTKAG